MLPRRLFGALPYQHTPREKLDVAFKLLSKHGALAPETSSSRRRLKFVDLGSGAGEAVLMASRKGFDALGVGERYGRKEERRRADRARCHMGHRSLHRPLLLSFLLYFTRRRDQPDPACHLASVAALLSN